MNHCDISIEYISKLLWIKRPREWTIGCKRERKYGMQAQSALFGDRSRNRKVQVLSTYYKMHINNWINPHIMVLCSAMYVLHCVNQNARFFIRRQTPSPYFNKIILYALNTHWSHALADRIVEYSYERVFILILYALIVINL